MPGSKAIAALREAVMFIVVLQDIRVRGARGCATIESCACGNITVILIIVGFRMNARPRVSKMLTKHLYSAALVIELVLQLVMLIRKALVLGALRT